MTTIQGSYHVFGGAWSRPPEVRDELSWLHWLVAANLGTIRRAGLA